LPMDLLGQYANSSDDEEEQMIPSVQPTAAPIERLKPTDPRRNSASIKTFKTEQKFFNPKLIENWNQGWQIDLQGSLVTEKHRNGPVKGVQALVSEAQYHTHSVSEGTKSSTPAETT